MTKIMDVIAKLAPGAKQAYIDGFKNNAVLFDQYRINTPLRWAHFTAQVFGETGGLVVVQENMNYSAARLVEIFGPGHSSAAVGPVEAHQIEHQPSVIAERVYGRSDPNHHHLADELGNTQAGDGFKFRGIGPLQSTGRAAARRWGAACRADFESDVMLMVAPQFIMLPPLLEWAAGGCNDLADQNNVKAIRKIINGGYNGLADVEQWLEKLWPLFASAGDASASWQAAAPDSGTMWLQDALNQLGYAPKLDPDGKSGPATRAGVKWFQQIAGLKPDGVAGDLTLVALHLRLNAMPAALAA